MHGFQGHRAERRGERMPIEFAQRFQALVEVLLFVRGIAGRIAVILRHKLISAP